MKFKSYKHLLGLIGAHLKTSEFMKLEQTTLAEVIAEEDGNEEYRNLCSLGKRHTPSLIGEKSASGLSRKKELPESLDVMSDKSSLTGDITVSS